MLDCFLYCLNAFWLYWEVKTAAKHLEKIELQFTEGGAREGGVLLFLTHLKIYTEW